MKARMKNEDQNGAKDEHIESVETILEKKPEAIEAAPLAYDMDSGTLLNNREELASVMRQGSNKKFIGICF